MLPAESDSGGRCNVTVMSTQLRMESWEEATFSFQLTGAGVGGVGRGMVLCEASSLSVSPCSFSAVVTSAGKLPPLLEKKKGGWWGVT